MCYQKMYHQCQWCMIKNFRGSGVVTPSKPPPPTNNFCFYPPPVLRCFRKDPLMTPTPTTPLQASFTANPLPIHHPFPLKILIIHMMGCQFLHWQDTTVCQISAPGATLPGQFPVGRPPSPLSRKQLIDA